MSSCPDFVSAAFTCHASVSITVPAMVAGRSHLPANLEFICTTGPKFVSTIWLCASARCPPHCMLVSNAGGAFPTSAFAEIEHSVAMTSRMEAASAAAATTAAERGPPSRDNSVRGGRQIGDPGAANRSNSDGLPPLHGASPRATRRSSFEEPDTPRVRTWACPCPALS